MKIALAIRHALSHWCRSRRGNVAIIAGLLMPCVVGLCGMGSDVGYWYYRERIVQAAADAAAYDGAVALSSGSTATSITSGASTSATANGWYSSKGTITVHTPPTSGTHQTSDSVEVILTETEPRFFSLMFSNAAVQVRSRAVATYYSSGLACMLALDKTAQNALQFWGNSTDTMVNCNVMSDSINSQSLGIGGSANVTAPCVLAVGGVYVSSSLTLTSCSTTSPYSKPVLDPYRNTSAPPIPTSCTNVPGNATSLTTGSTHIIKICNNLRINSSFTFGPGVYVINGGTFALDGLANVSGSGVMFYLTNGASVSFNATARMNLSAPTSDNAYYTGETAGMLFFGDRTMSNANQTFNGDSTSVLTGAIYFPSQTVQMNGNYSGVNGCMQVVADEISYSGNVRMSTNCSGTGLSGIPLTKVLLDE